MNGIRPVERSLHRDGSTLENVIRKSGIRKVSVAFERKTDAEKRSQDSKGGKNKKNVTGVEEKRWKGEREDSASCFRSERSFARESKTRPRSSEGVGGAPPPGGEGDGRSRRRRGCEWTAAPGAGSRTPSGCGSWAAQEERREPWACFRFPCRARRKCRSSCGFFDGGSRNREKESGGSRDFHKVRRSLRLLGFEPSDFAVPSSGTDTTTERKLRRSSPTFSTRITGRSVSLDSVRATVRRAWLDDRLDSSHRRLLAQAAYEEWYFTKERELREKREENRMQRLKTKLKLRDDLERKKEKSEEEFKKWLNGKKTKRKGHEGNLVQKRSPLNRMVEAKEKSERAFLNWKKNKEGEIKRKKIQKRKEEEDEIAADKQKAERKIIAEKAFQQWKAKLEESERKRNTKGQMRKKRQETEDRRKRAEGSQISFQMWKKAKDELIKEKIKQCREAERAAKEERFAQMEERMYEAEQAFEDWLERVDLRKEKQLCGITSYEKIIPWIPA